MVLYNQISVCLQQKHASMKTIIDFHNWYSSININFYSSIVGSLIFFNKF